MISNQHSSIYFSNCLVHLKLRFWNAVQMRHHCVIWNFYELCLGVKKFMRSMRVLEGQWNGNFHHNFTEVCYQCPINDKTISGPIMTFPDPGRIFQNFSTVNGFQDHWKPCTLFWTILPTLCGWSLWFPATTHHQLDAGLLNKQSGLPSFNHTPFTLASFIYAYLLAT